MSTNNNHHGDDHTPEELAAAKLTALALGQLPADESSTLERGLVTDQREIREIESLSRAIATAHTAEKLPERSISLKKQLEAKLAGDSIKIDPAKHHAASRRWAFIGWGVAACLLIAVASVPFVQQYRAAVRRNQASNHLKAIGLALQNYHDTFSAAPGEIAQLDDSASLRMAATPRIMVQEESIYGFSPNYGNVSGATNQFSNGIASELNLERQANSPDGAPLTPGGEKGGLAYAGEFARRVAEAEWWAAKAQAENQSEIELAEKAVEVSKAEYDQSLALRQKNPAAVSITHLRKDKFNYEKALVQLKQAAAEKRIAELNGYQAMMIRKDKIPPGSLQGGEQYAPIHENSFLSPLRQPLSTFSIDVDTASYANTRRFLTNNQLPPPNAVRIEELVNYFRYDYPQPKEDQPFSVNMETAECPWREGHLLLRVGLKGKDVEREKRPASNLVFLLDVSGSMSDENKLPLLKTAMKMLVGELGENDRVSIVTYAGDAGLKLPSAHGHEQQRINAAIDSLQSGGSTNGSAGIELAYEQATAHFIEGGTNRVILCTDGDLNVGITSDEALVELIKLMAATSHVSLTVLGFGQGNLQDAKMERLADNGNGLYAYIDSVREARKVLVEQLTGSTITIAKDVKIQIEFNPAQIAAYRLLGYENRVMAAQDFNNDKKDAGEIGAGHTVTALYELVPVGAAAANADQNQPGVDALKYQQPTADPFAKSPSPEPRAPSPESPELLTLKLRYKQPSAETSQLLEYPLSDRGHSFNSASPDFQFAAAVASFGMVLRNSQHRGSSNLAAVAEVASSAIGTDAGGYRAEFIDLVRKAQAMGK